MIERKEMKANVDVSCSIPAGSLTYRNLFLFAWTVGHRSLFLSFYNALCLNVPHPNAASLKSKKGMDV
jgi:hypothetical protein